VGFFLDNSTKEGGKPIGLKSRRQKELLGLDEALQNHLLSFGHQKDQSVRYQKKNQGEFVMHACTDTVSIQREINLVYRTRPAITHRGIKKNIA